MISDDVSAQLFFGLLRYLPPFPVATYWTGTRILQTSSAGDVASLHFAGDILGRKKTFRPSFATFANPKS